MRIKNIYIVSIIYFLLSFIPTLRAQELNCQVNVSTPQVQGSNKEVYDDMRKAIYEFMNNRVWTDHVFKEEERIDCTMLFNITDRISDDEFKGTLQIQARRPVFGTSYYTNLLNHRDNDIHFKYVEFQQMDYNETGQNSSLISILAYYANIILGLDYDSFSLEGGSLFFQRAETIVTNAANLGESGWRSFEGTKNRYWLTENILNGKYNAVRSCLYRYHRLGLDRMSEVVDEGRAEIADALSEMRPAFRENPTAMIFTVFFSAKSDEIVSIFSQSYPDEKGRVVNVLKEIDPGNTAKWDRITKSGN